LSGREELSDPSEEKYDSLAAFWSVDLPSFKSGLVVFEEESDGEAESARNVAPALVRAEARDFRKPWAEEGRLPEVARPLRGAVKPSGGAEADQALS
jgi:hypothetical protein